MPLAPEDPSNDSPEPLLPGQDQIGGASVIAGLRTQSKDSTAGPGHLGIGRVRGYFRARVRWVRAPCAGWRTEEPTPQRQLSASPEIRTSQAATRRIWVSGSIHGKPAFLRVAHHGRVTAPAKGPFQFTPQVSAPAAVFRNRQRRDA
jgi:hypothetical protein